MSSNMFPVKTANTAIRSAQMLSRKGTKTFYRLDNAAHYLNAAFDAECHDDLVRACDLASQARKMTHMAGLATNRFDLIDACLKAHQTVSDYEQVLWSLRLAAVAV
jgi:hypothetical protein